MRTPVVIEVFRPQHEMQVIDLWQRCGLVVPQNDPADDIRRKLGDSADQFLVLLAEQKVIGTIMFGYDGHRGWLNYLAVDPGWQGQGLGRRLVELSIDQLKTLGCAKVNLQVRAGNDAVIKFYTQLGFIQDKVVSLGRRLVD